MSERDYVGFFLWAMAFMIAIGGMIPQMWPSLVGFVDRTFLNPPRRRLARKAWPPCSRANQKRSEKKIPNPNIQIPKE